MNLKKTFLYCLKQSSPIFIAFLPVGLAYGVLMQNAGYNVLWVGLTSLFVDAGSLQFLMVNFFTDSVPLITVAVMALLVNSRHIFYGLPFIEKFRTLGPWRHFVTYYLTDETFSLHCARKCPEGVDEKWAYIFTTVQVVGYWLILSMLGTWIGSLITIDMTGVDFAMTALFVVILVDQLRGADNRLPAIAAVISSVVCLAIFGPGSFILPSLAVTVAALVLLRNVIEPGKEAA
ncbi:MAG: AzlC family ABC transporter permease [Clostridiales bacterium]|nr:AzlC family ABC transporter permease [Candidatus Cacconaster stercorequi]